MNVQVKLSENVTQYLVDLVFTLVARGYFSYYETALKYTQGIIDEVHYIIRYQPKKTAPPYFLQYGKDLYYVTCRRNRTTWYVFFTIHGVYGEYCIIRHITNNHMAGQLFG